jgi:hypothetical protein
VVIGYITRELYITSFVENNKFFDKNDEFLAIITSFFDKNDEFFNEKLGI